PAGLHAPVVSAAADPDQPRPQRRRPDPTWRDGPCGGPRPARAGSLAAHHDWQRRDHHWPFCCAREQGCMTPAAASKTWHEVGAPLLEELDSRVGPIDGHQPAELTGVL